MPVRPKHFDRGTQEPEEQPLGRGGTLGFLTGIVIGVAAGLIGVGGGEFRIPVLLNLLRLPVKEAAGANTLIGLFVVVLSVARRWGQQPLTRDDLALGGIMASFSVVGAVMGARRAHRLSTRLLKRIVCLYLLVVGVWMVVEGLAEVEHTLFEPQGWIRWTLAAVVGFLIAAASGALGVAGGEMRIPALMYLFAMPVKVAGTVSLIASIPTVAAGAAAYRRLGHLPNRVAVLSVLTGAGSLIGVLVGASILPYVSKHTLKALLGAILLASTVCLTVPGLFNRRAPDEPVSLGRATLRVRSIIVTTLAGPTNSSIDGVGVRDDWPGTVRCSSSRAGATMPASSDDSATEAPMNPNMFREALRRRYADVAERADGQFQYPIGRESARRLDYRRDLVDLVPADVVEHFVGVGNPFSMGEPEPGWNVLDVGCGFDTQEELEDDRFAWSN